MYAVVEKDLQLVVSQVDKTFQAKNLELAKCFQSMVRMQKYFLGFVFRSIPRGDNKEAYALAKAAAQGTPLPPMYSLRFSKPKW